MAVDTSTVQVVMPAMGDSVAEGTVLEWHKQEGDTVAADETIVEISTDKVDAEVPRPSSGTVTRDPRRRGRHRRGRGASGRDRHRRRRRGGRGAERQPPPPRRRRRSQASRPRPPPARPSPARRTEAEGVAAAEQAAGKTVDIVTPTGGESVTEGTILEWSVKVGDAVKDGDTVVEISTDKVDMELPAPADGHDHRDPGRGGRDGHRRPGHRADERSEPQPAPRHRAMAAAPRRPRRRAQAGSAGAPRPAAAPPPPATAQTPTPRRSPAGSPPPRASTSRRSRAAPGAAGSPRPTCSPPATAPPAPPAPTAPAAGAQLIKGGGAALARYMDQSRSIPTATSFRTLTVTMLDERRKQLKNGGQRGLLHPPDRLRDRAGGHRGDAGDGPPLRGDRRQALPPSTTAPSTSAWPSTSRRRTARRTLMVPVIRDAGRLSFAEFLDAYNALVEKARTNTLTADDLTGGNVTLTNPGGIGTIASVPRLMVGQGTIVATGSIAYPVGLERIGPMIGAEKVMTMTSTYDHRIIQGAESGRFLQRIEALLQGDEGFYEQRVRRPRRRAARAAAAARAGRRRGRRRRARPRPRRRRRAGARRGADAGRAGRHLAAQGPPHPRPPGRPARPARPRVRGRSRRSTRRRWA